LVRIIVIKAKNKARQGEERVGGSCKKKEKRRVGRKD
jgi:hypothetical protein